MTVEQLVAPEAIQTPAPLYEHIFKNAYLVHSYAGIEAAAVHRSHNKNVSLKSNFDLEGKYPLVVVISGTRDFVHVYMAWTEATLKRCLTRLEELK